MSNEGIIYLLQPKELIMSYGYKIGYTFSEDFRRFNNYNSGAKLIYAIRCKNVTELENKLKQILPTKFTLLSGREYFTCINDDLSDMFFDITTEHNKNIKLNTEKSLLKIKPFLPKLDKINNGKTHKIIAENNTQIINNIQNITNNVKISNNTLPTTNAAYSENELNKNIFKCSSCNINLCSITAYRNHCKSKKHISTFNKTNIDKINDILPNNLNKYKCIQCDISLKSMTSYRYHCKSKQHIQKLIILYAEHNSMNIYPNSVKNNQLNQTKHQNEFACNLCGKSFCNKGNITRHKKKCKSTT